MLKVLGRGHSSGIACLDFSDLALRSRPAKSSAGFHVREFLPARKQVSFWLGVAFLHAEALLSIGFRVAVHQRRSKTLLMSPRVAGNHLENLMNSSPVLHDTWLV